MEFIKTLSLIRRKLPFTFYGLLIVIPGVVTLALYSASLMVPELANEIVNAYTITFYAYLAGLNLFAWLRLHNQRLGRLGKANLWSNMPFISAVLVLSVLAIDPF